MLLFQTESEAMYELDTRLTRVRRIEPGRGASKRIGPAWAGYKAIVMPVRLGHPVVFLWPDRTYTATLPVWMIIEDTN